jgi:hypothetical protein
MQTRKYPTDRSCAKGNNRFGKSEAVAAPDVVEKGEGVAATCRGLPITAYECGKMPQPGWHTRPDSARPTQLHADWIPHAKKPMNGVIDFLAFC